MRKCKVFVSFLVLIFLTTNISFIPGSRQIIQFRASESWGESVDSYTKLLMHFDGTNGSTSFSDVCGHAVTLNGNVQINNNCALFDGAGDFLSINNNSDFNFGSDDWTVEFLWNTPNSILNGQPMFVSTMDSGVGSMGWSIQYYKNIGKLIVTIGNTTSSSVSIPWSPEPNSIYHIGVSRKSGYVYVFINGVLQNIGGTITGNPIDSNLPLMIGRDNYNSLAYHLNGSIDELKISKGIARWTSNFNAFNCSIDDSYTKVLLHFNSLNNSSFFIDDCGHPLSTNGDVQINNIQSKFGGYSGYFDGNGDYLRIPYSSDFNIDSDLTIDTWAKGNGTIYSTGLNTVNSTMPINLGVTPTGMLSVVICYSDQTRLELTTADGIVNLLTWYHIACVKSGNNVYIFANGALAASGILTKTLASTTEYVQIGRNNNSVYSNYFNGYIDEFRLSKGIARWTSNFTPPNNPYSNSIKSAQILSYLPSQNSTLFQSLKTEQRSV